MRRKMKAIVNIVLIGLVLLFATGYRFNSQYANSGMRGHMSGPNVSNFGRHHRDESHMGRNGSSRNDNNFDSFSGRSRMHHTDILRFEEIKGESNKLKLPEILEPDFERENEVSYTLKTQRGETQLKEGRKTATMGYNGSYLGPILKMRKGQTVHIKTENNLSEETTFHWHGLKIPSDVDGGPHSPVEPNQAAQIDFEVNQEAATLWFHPHALGTTAEQVYYGLAGLIYVEDEQTDRLDLPKEYGVNDFPLILQDRNLDENNQLDYERAYNPDGVYGNTLLVNGTLNPYVEVKNEKVRLRLVNGSNARNYQLVLNNQARFYQIASDGGFLEEPVEMTSLVLAPGERAEIIIDLEDYPEGETIQLMDGETTVLDIGVKGTTDVKKELPRKLNTIPVRETSDSLPVKKMTLAGMGYMVSIDGKQFDMDRIDMEETQGETAIWEIYNAPDMMGGMAHPFHVHGLQFKIISRDGKTPPLNEQGWKDTVLIEAGETVQLELEFPEKGIFMYHCHILEHEDVGMMGQVEVK